MITANSINIVIPYLNGTWKVVEEQEYHGQKIFLLEREQKDFLIQKITVDEEGKPFMK